MADPKKRGDRPPARRRGPTDRGAADPPIEEDPAVERGERIDTGKTIARGGQTKGHVPGATEQKP